MIDRSVLKDPNKDFDFFNDFTNSFNWLHALPQTDERDKAIEILKSRHDEWLIEWNKPKPLNKKTNASKNWKWNK